MDKRSLKSSGIIERIDDLTDVELRRGRFETGPSPSSVSFAVMLVLLIRTPKRSQTELKRQQGTRVRNSINLQIDRSRFSFSFQSQVSVWIVLLCASKKTGHSFFILFLVCALDDFFWMISRLLIPYQQVQHFVDVHVGCRSTVQYMYCTVHLELLYVVKANTVLYNVHVQRAQTVRSCTVCIP